MSRSIHQTLKSVFGGLSKTEVRALGSEQDSDVMELARKRMIKRSVKQRRRAERKLWP